MKEFALRVDREDGQWVVSLHDEAGWIGQDFSSDLNRALRSAASSIALVCSLDDAPPVLRGGHP